MFASCMELGKEHDSKRLEGNKLREVCLQKCEMRAPEA